jgi:hypothetical protein
MARMWNETILLLLEVLLSQHLPAAIEKNQENVNVEKFQSRELELETSEDS